MDAIYSSHNIEHLYPHQVNIALREFHRVLTPEGFAVLTCPDLQSACQAVAEDRLLDVMYVSPAGPIAAIDILYGHRGLVAQGNIYMGHKCGFTLRALIECLQETGFQSIFGKRRLRGFDLWVVAYKQATSEDTVKATAAYHFPQ